jgi:hypothetical protein
MSALLSFLGGRIAAPFAGAVALLFAVAFLWQSARINGVPLLGGGFKVRIAALERQRDLHALADARAEAALLRAQAGLVARGENQARAHLAMQRAADAQIKTVVKEVPVYVSASSDAKCILPWGAVRLLDAAASGADPAGLRDRIAPGQPDDAASSIALSDAVALLAGNLGAARQNAGQLEHLQRAVAPPE